MNYDEARQLKEGGWHWTSMHDGTVRTAIPCIWFDDLEFNDALGPPLPPNRIHRCPPHATREEAERHFYNHSLANMQEGETSNWNGCEVCDTPTKKTLGNRGMHGYFSEHFLCDQHRNKEELQKLQPFHTGIQVIHS